jgi:hypothetical protein
MAVVDASRERTASRPEPFDDVSLHGTLVFAGLVIHRLADLA